jgi:HEAT repeat protein
MLNGTDAAAQILLQALTTTSGRPRVTLIAELAAMRDERAAPLYCYLVKKIDRRSFPIVYLGAVDALGSFGGPDAVEALKEALYLGEWTAPMRTRRARAAAARSLRKIGDAAAVATLQEASTRGSRGVRAAAKAELKRLG